MTVAKLVAGTAHFRQPSSTGCARPAGTVGDFVDYEGVYLLCYLRGPEGLIVELAETLRSKSR